MKFQQNRFNGIARIIALMAVVFVLMSVNTVYSQGESTHHNKKIKKATNTESIIRTGKIDLKKIDKNKDGNVFQCPMDWNVISDKAGQCPTCKMNLEKVTIAKAKENLVKHGYKTK